MKRICQYLQGVNDKGLVFNPYNKLVVDCYAGSYFAGLWIYKNPQDHICTRIRNGFVVTFSICLQLWMSKIQTEIDLSTLHSKCVALSHSVRYLIPLKSIIKEVIENLVIDSDKTKFLSSSTVYEGKNGDMVVGTSPRMTPTSVYISVKYHWFGQHVAK